MGGRGQRPRRVYDPPDSPPCIRKDPMHVLGLGLALILPAHGGGRSDKAAKLAAQAQEAFEASDRVQARKLADRSLRAEANADALGTLVLCDSIALMEEVDALRAQGVQQLPAGDFAPLVRLERHIAALEALKPDSVALSIGRQARQSLLAPTLVEPAQPVCSPLAVEAYEQAEQLFSTGAFEAALSRYDAALELCPEQTTWWTWSGDAALRTHGPAAALERYRRAVALDPCQHVAHRFVADTVLGLPGLDDTAIHDGFASAVRSVACKPDYEPGWATLRAWLAVSELRLMVIDLRQADPEGYRRLLARAAEQPSGSALDRRVAALLALRAEDPEGGLIVGATQGIEDVDELRAIVAWETLDAEIAEDFRALRVERLETLSHWVLASRVLDAEE